MGIGDWGLGIGDWANPQSPIPNPQSQSPTKKLKTNIVLNIFYILINIIISHIKK